MVALSRWISCCASPRLFTNSMLRSDSVVDPASAVVLHDGLLHVLILWLSSELSPPSSGIVPDTPAR